MPKKKGGFGKKKIQEMTQLTRLRRLYGIPAAEPYQIRFVPTEDAQGIKAVPVYRAAIKKAVILSKKLAGVKLGQKYAVTKPAGHAIASVIVETSSREVLQGLGVSLMDVQVKPEIVHAVGKLVAARAIGMAKDYMAAGSPSGGGRMGAGGIIASIGRTGLEVEVGPSGKVSAKVSTKATRKKLAKNAEAPARVEVPADVSVKKDDRTKVEVGHKAVIKAKDGTTTIIIENLNVYITANLVEEMYVNPERVYHQLNGELEEITGAIMEKPADEEKEENQEGEEQEDNSEDERSRRRPET